MLFAKTSFRRVSDLITSQFTSSDASDFLFEGNPVGEGTTRRGTVTVVHFRKHPQVPHTAQQGA